MKYLSLSILFVIFAFLSILPVRATIRYVKAGALGDGSSWIYASGDLQRIINESSEGDQIWVASGTYFPDRQPDDLHIITPDNRNNAFVISNNIQLYGGFAGNETNIHERSGDLTILSGNRGILSGTNGFFHVLIFTDGSEAVLDGFIITGGNADGSGTISVNGRDFKRNVGGGIYIVRASPRLNNIVIKDNSAVYGGGVYSFHSFPCFSNVMIVNNSAEKGGGLYNDYSFPELTNMTICQNSGGGIYNAISNPSFYNSVVRENQGNKSYDRNLHNDVLSHSDYSYSLMQSETTDVHLITPADDNEEKDEAGMFIYVSPDGNDFNTGTEEAPLATISGARNKIRAIKAAGMPVGGVIAYFKGGIYPVTERVCLTDEDSGTDLSPVIYKAYPGEIPVFTGGRYIPGSAFRNVTDAVMLDRLAPEVRDKVLCYDLFANGFSFNDLDYSQEFWKQDNLKEHVVEKYHENNYFVPRMQVFMDDEALYLARYPNKVAGIFQENPYNSYLPIDEIYGGRGVPGSEGEEAWDGKNPKFRIEEPRMKNWRSHDDIIVFGMTGFHFENERNLVKEINTQEMTVELQSMPTYGLFDEARVAFENVFEELDRPGEYYIDKNTGVLYLYPVKDMRQVTVKIAVLDENFMIDVKDASFVTFSGLTFELTKSSVFFIRGGQSCTVQNCNVKNFGIWGVRLGDNALSTTNYVEAWNAGKFDEYLHEIPASTNGYNHKVTGCNFLNTGHHACRIASGNVGSREKGNMVFENNMVRHSGLIGSTYRSGLELQGAGIMVKNNSFFYCLGQAISGNIIDTEILNNEFCDSPCDMAEDTGTLYLNYLNMNNGVKIRYNFFHDVSNLDIRFGSGFGYALRSVVGYDNNAPFRDFSYNVVYNYPLAGVIGIAAPWTCFNNVFIDCDVVLPYYGEFFDSYKGKTAMDILTEQGQSTIAGIYRSGIYKDAFWKEKYPELYAYFEYMAHEKADLQQPMDQIYNNLIVNINKPFHDRNSGLDEIRIPPDISVDPKYGKISNNNYLFYDPGFLSVTNRNLQLPRDVTARYGLEWIDMERIGSENTKQIYPALPVTAAIVHNDAELKDALADGSVDAILFANDIIVRTSELLVQPKRARPDLVIDGNGYTLTEFAVANNERSKGICLESKGTIASLTVRSLNINGCNGAGSIHIGATDSIALIYRNVTYTGPKLAENVSGSILLDNTNVRICPSGAHGNSEEPNEGFAGEAVRTAHLRFRDVVNIKKDYDSDGVMEAVIKLTGMNPSLIVETFPRQTEVTIEYAGLEVEPERFVGGGGAIDADHLFDFILEKNAAIRYKGFYEYLSGAMPLRIVESWNSTLGILIYEDVKRGITDKILSVAGDVIIGKTSSIDMDVHGPLQCLLEVNGHLSVKPGGFLLLNGYKFDPTIPGIEPAKYPVLLMKGGANSGIIFDRPEELFIRSQHMQQDWMRSVGFMSDGIIKMTAHRFSFIHKGIDKAIQYEAADNSLITLDVRIKGGIDGITQSLSYQTESGASIVGGLPDEDVVDMKNITEMTLRSDKDRLPLNPDEYPNQFEAASEPIYGKADVGNLEKNTDPLFVNASAGNFMLKKESPLINAGNNQVYLGARGLYGFDEEKDLAGNARLYEDNIDIGVYEYDPLGTGNETSAVLPDGISVWSQQSRLFIHSKIPVKMNIYTISGLLFRRLELQANGTVVLNLERNIYFIVPDNHKAHKVFVY